MTVCAFFNFRDKKSLYLTFSVEAAFSRREFPPLCGEKTADRREEF